MAAFTAAAALRSPASADSATSVVGSTDLVQAARDHAKQIGAPVEVPSLDDEYSTTYAEPDGTLRTDTSVTPLRVSQNGRWVSVNYDLIHAGNAWVPAASPVPVAFTDGGDADAADVGTGAKLVQMSWDVTLPAPSIEGPTATYDIGGGESVVLTATPTGFEQSLVLDQPPTTIPHVRLPFDPSGLTMVRTADGRYEFDNPSGVPVYEIASPTMYGSAEDPNTGLLQQHVVTTSMVDTANGPRLDLTPSLAWLNDPGTEYPVTIDPIVSQPSESEDTYVQNSVATSEDNSTILHVGMYGIGGLYASRSYLRFDGMSAFAGDSIVSATLKLWNNSTSSCTVSHPFNVNALTAPFSSSTIWNNKPTSWTTQWASTGNFAYGASGCASNFGSIDVTSMVAAWAAGATPNYGMQLMGAAETNGYPHWDFCSMDYSPGLGDCNTASHAPTLTVSYNLPPGPITIDTMCAVPAQDQCISPETTADDAPDLTASAVDAGGSNLDYSFELWTSDGTSPTGTAPIDTGSAYGVASGETASYTPGDLSDATTYQYRVMASNGLANTAWSPWFIFTTGIASEANKPSGGSGMADTSLDDAQKAALNDLTNQLNSVLDNLPLLYTGMAITADGQINIYVPPVGGVVDELTSVLSGIDLGGVQLNWITVSNPLQTLLTTMDSITQDSDYLTSQGLDVTAYGPEPADAKIEIDLANYSDALANVLYDRYGANNVEVRAATGNLPQQAVGRYADSAPWWASDALLSNRYTGPILSDQPPHADCTSSATLADSHGNTYIPTAGHCWANGKVVWNGGRRFGTVSQRKFYNRGTDVELIKTAGGARVWDGYATKPDVTDYHNGYDDRDVVVDMFHGFDPIGGYVCYDGANSGLMCDAKVTRANFCLKFDGEPGGPAGKTTCYLTETLRKAFGYPSNAVQRGDSGGPVIMGGIHGGVLIHGQIVGAQWFSGYDYFESESSILNVAYPSLHLHVLVGTP